jgi:hypothetical protein
MISLKPPLPVGEHQFIYRMLYPEFHIIGYEGEEE